MSRRFSFVIGFCLLLAVDAMRASAEEATVAVASNFVLAMERLERDFETRTDHTLRVTSGSTGKLFAQIVHGAPIDVLLAADRARPSLLAARDLAEASSQRTYAIGRLAIVWREDVNKEPVAGRSLEAWLHDPQIKRVAMANPDLAPYGLAAKEVISALGLLPEISPRLVRGENVAQTFALVATGNADLGFVSWAQIQESGERSGFRDHSRIVPSELHGPIRQDAILVRRGASNRAARAFLDYLVSVEGRALIKSLGYEVES